TEVDGELLPLLLLLGQHTVIAVCRDTGQRDPIRPAGVRHVGHRPHTLVARPPAHRACCAHRGPGRPTPPPGPRAGWLPRWQSHEPWEGWARRPGGPGPVDPGTACGRCRPGPGTGARLPRS